MTAEDIINAVEKALGIPRAEILGKSRRQDIAEARHVATIMIQEELGWTYTKTAKFMGLVHHSSVVHSLNLKTSPHIAFALKRVLPFFRASKGLNKSYSDFSVGGYVSGSIPEYFWRPA